MATKAAKKSGKQKRKESRRLVLPREDAKAVDKYSRRERQTDGDKKARAAQRATQGRHLHGYQGCQEVRQAEEEGVKKARVAQRGRQGC